MEKPLLVEKRGALAEVTLNRPQVLNALNDEMRGAMLPLLPDFAGDSEIYAMVLRSNSPRAFCAGGDVRELTRLGRADPAQAVASVGQEYFLNWALECFTKPTVSLIDGMVMGSGVGLMLYGTHRVAGEGFCFAMPETAIGLFPDVGACSVLAKLPGHMGRYIGLTGRTIGRQTAYRLGIVTHCIAASQFDQIRDGLGAADTVDPLLDNLHVDSSAGAFDDGLIGRGNLIEDVFGGTSLAGMFRALEFQAKSASADAAWCADVLSDLQSRAPLSLLVTLRHLDACRSQKLQQVLIDDYRLAARFLTGHDFYEGVRALLIDLDNKPAWQHGGINEVSPEEIDEYFAELVVPELELPDREKMQQTQA